jgi:hypothetical protein
MTTSFKNLLDQYTTMPTEEEIAAQIVALGEKIKQAKAEKKPKEEWDPFLQEMLALKVSFRVVRAKSFTFESTRMYCLYLCVCVCV